MACRWGQPIDFRVPARRPRAPTLYATASTTYAKVLTRPRWLRRDDDLGYLLGVLRNTHISRLRYQDRRPREVPLESSAEPADLRAS